MHYLSSECITIVVLQKRKCHMKFVGMFIICCNLNCYVPGCSHSLLIMIYQKLITDFIQVLSCFMYDF